MRQPPSHHALHFFHVAVLIAGGLAAADARDTRMSLGPGTRVAAVAQMELQSMPTHVAVTRDDLARGYVDVDQATALVIRSNSPVGYALEVTTVTPMFSSVVVYGLDTERSLGADGGTIVQHWQDAHAANLTLRFRLMLEPGLAAGDYPWPMVLRALPIETL